MKTTLNELRSKLLLPMLKLRLDELMHSADFFVCCPPASSMHSVFFSKFIALMRMNLQYPCKASMALSLSWHAKAGNRMLVYSRFRKCRMEIRLDHMLEASSDVNKSQIQ